MAVKVTTRFADSPRNGAWGDRPYAIIDHQGPLLYVPVVVGVSPAVPTGGDPIAPAEFGLSTGLEGIFMVGGSLTGTYIVYAFQLGAYNQGLGNPTWALKWVIAATGVEAGAIDLSGEVVRLVGFGPY
jgi:hypothetical protein